MQIITNRKLHFCRESIRAPMYVTDTNRLDSGSQPTVVLLANAIVNILPTLHGSRKFAANCCLDIHD